jgi:hypothetical protein
MCNHGLVTPDIGLRERDRTSDLVFPKHASYRWTTRSKSSDSGVRYGLSLLERFEVLKKGSVREPCLKFTEGSTSNTRVKIGRGERN